MKIKKIISLLLSILLLFCTTACKSNDAVLSSNVETDSSTATDKNDPTDTTYNFSSIKEVEYYCVKNFTESDTIYSVSSIITDSDTDICNFTTKILCEDENVKIEDKIITVPYKYTKTKKAVKLTAYHLLTDISYDFTIKPEKSWDLIFEDNFEGTQIDETKWNLWDLPDWQYFYSPDSFFLDGKGSLINRISILDTPNPEYNYDRQAGSMTTLDKFETTYGYFEIRMKPYLATGMRSAFWLVAGDMGDVDAANDSSAVNGCEIDIVETYVYTSNPAQTIHWDGYYNDQTKSENFSFAMDEVFDGEYHTFALRWSPNEYAFLIDGKVTAKTKHMGICNQPGYLLISSHFCDSGEMLLKPGESTDMAVDYVKVYQSPTDLKEK